MIETYCEDHMEIFSTECTGCVKAGLRKPSWYTAWLENGKRR